MPKMTELELKLILDIEIHLFIEKGIRGGFSYIAKRFSKENNKYMHFMMITNQVNTLHILMQIIYMVGQ